jgi:hypothetical protein
MPAGSLFRSQAIPPIGSVIYADPARTACYCVAGTAPFRSDCFRSAIFLNSNNSFASRRSGWPGRSWNLALFRQPPSAAPLPGPAPHSSFRRSCFQPEKRCMLLKLRHRAPRLPPQTGFVSHSSFVRVCRPGVKGTDYPACRTRSPTPPLYTTRSTARRPGMGLDRGRAPAGNPRLGRRPGPADTRGAVSQKRVPTFESSGAPGQGSPACDDAAHDAVY